MRLPVDACVGCNENAQLLPSGFHVLDDGVIKKCAFVAEELKDLGVRRGESSPLQFIGVYTDKRRAVSVARSVGGALHWIGQAPHNYWIVLKDRS